MSGKRRRLGSDDAISLAQDYFTSVSRAQNAGMCLKTLKFITHPWGYVSINEDL